MKGEGWGEKDEKVKCGEKGWKGEGWVERDKHAKGGGKEQGS